MANFMEAAQAWLAGTLTAHASVAVTYTRGRKAVTLSAVPARPRAQGVTPGSAAAGRVGLDDERVVFHFAPALLDFGAGPVEPAVGDRLTVGTVVREVVRDGTQPAWRRSDVGDNLVAVNTMRVA